ncbi:hypothetical protein IMG5_051050 [Ichthyophthirius multifiliis]|uniref:Thioredoxin domain-containing protein n=1 Tax=Ichthyophthirius multifiliis TaxID=5932 RepID=G0QMQ2_ICHMU|nr:hypothetical protein IMG5_051050 [Ichthyophthirius multifiliis]EGR33508.1 hypothetical protein IMG5_051050 [Ichthyophthirius multifiliis]|eukprot:XP_004037494.1 hypothetical protein IMG5_051050 [Ichthyophthirius multifiliis]
MQDKNGIYILNPQNFNDFVTQNEHVFIDFYAPWCDHCKQLDPEFIKISQNYQNQNVKFAKSDMSIHMSLSKKYKVDGYPDLRLFSFGNLEHNIKYIQDQKKEEDLRNWLNQKIEKSSEKINHIEQLEELKQKNQALIVYFGLNEQETNFQTFKLVAMSYEETKFAYVLDQQIRAQEQAEDLSIVLYKNFDNKRDEYTGELKIIQIIKFIDSHSIPHIIPFDKRAVSMIFVNQNPALFFVCNNNQKSINALKEFEKSALQNKGGNVIFSVSKQDDGFENNFNKLIDILDVNEKDLPVIKLVYSTSKRENIYAFQKDITAENINEFVILYQKGKLKRQRTKKDDL